MGLLRARFLPALLLLLVASAQSASGQNGDSCRIVVENAETYYRDGDFEEAVRLLEPCIDRGHIPADLVVPAHRFMALARLQLGDIAGARLAVLRLVAQEPSYQPDPVQDPPGYQALVRTVREQLDDPAFSQELEVQRLERARREQDAPATADPAAPSYRQTRALAITAQTGLASYGGERGVNAASPLAEFVENAGLTLALGLAYNFSPYVAMDLEYGASSFPTVHDDKARFFEEIDPDRSSSVLHSIATSVVVRFLPTRPASPYGRLGGGFAFMYINDNTNGATVADLALGVDLRLSSTVGLLAEIRPRYVFPADAIDLVDRTGGPDLLTSFRVGIAWQVAGH